MLFVTRREGEEIAIGPPAQPWAIVKISRIQGRRVRIGVQAHTETPVHRREVADRIAAEGATTAEQIKEIVRSMKAV